VGELVFLLFFFSHSSRSIEPYSRNFIFRRNNDAFLSFLKWKYEETMPWVMIIRDLVKGSCNFIDIFL